MFGIASRIIKQKKQVSKITVDYQSEFNKAQQTLQDFYSKMPTNQSYQIGPGLPEMNLKGMPTIPITFSPSNESVGLELVDIFLWVFKRQFEGKKLPSELMALIRSQVSRGSIDEVSLNALSEKWGKWFKELPNVSDEDMKTTRDILDMHEAARLKAVKKSP